MAYTYKKGIIQLQSLFFSTDVLYLHRHVLVKGNYVFKVRSEHKLGPKLDCLGTQIELGNPGPFRPGMNFKGNLKQKKFFRSPQILYQPGRT